MSEKDINNIDGEPGLRFEHWESQDKDGDVIKAMQEKNAIETTRYYSNLFTNSNRIKQVETNTAKASLDTYIGINERQWNDKAVKKLDDQNRVAHTFNITKPNVDKVYGQIVLNPNETIFTPINQKDNSKRNIVQSLYDYDYERGGWQREINRFIKDTLIHTGILEMYKDYSHSPLGNIGLRALNRYLDVRFDPYWSTENISDCEYIFKSTWRTARELKDTYQTKSHEIDRSINTFEKRDGASIDNESVEVLASRDSEFYDATRDRYRVIEVTYMQKVYKKKKYADKLENYVEDNSNPDTNRGDNETLIEYNEYENICKVMTMVPGVSHGLILQEGNHPVQIGKLPFFVASSDTTMGERQGIVTGVIDAQVNLNKTKSMITGNQVVSTNGALIIKQNYFKDKAETARFKRDRNIPGNVFEADDNAKLGDGIIPVPTSRPPEGLDRSVDWTEQFIEKYMNNTDAINARSGSNESNLLFQSKKMQTQVAHVGVMEVIAQIEKEIAEAYFYFCKKVYKGPKRSFTNAKTGEQFTINDRVPIEDDKFASLEIGNASVNNFLANFRTINEIATLPRHDVIIKRSEHGLDQKQTTLNTYDQMMQRSVNPAMKALWEKYMIPLMDVPEQGIKDMQAAADTFVTFQMAQMKTQIKQMNNATVQSTIQTEQLAQQAGQPPQTGLQPPQDARNIGNGPGQGNTPESIASDSSGTNNQSASDA
jgi:hypothetical protein